VGPADADPQAVGVRRILLVWPVFQALYPRPFERFLQIAFMAGRACPETAFGVHVVERQGLVTAMNMVGDLVLNGPNQYGTGWDAAIVFDDDCFPPIDVIPRLLRRCFDEGHAFVAATGLMRAYPFTTTAARSYAEGITGVLKPDGKITHLAGFEWIDELPQDLVEVDFCGVPAAIIHKRCFEQIPRPWFGDSDVRGERVTHDVYFCKKLHAAGIPVHVDGTMRCGHLIDPPVINFENRTSARQVMEAPPMDGIFA
jgi:hypothetical protein